MFLPPLPAFLTGVPVFLGVADFKENKNGDDRQPVKLRLWTEFTSKFQQLDNKSYLYSAVQGFFLNGGIQCYVLPLLSKDKLSDALEIAEDMTGIDLVCAPGFTDPNDQQAILEHCTKLGDRFAILDAPPSLNRPQVDLKTNLVGSYGAIYSPWIQIEQVAKSQSTQYVPPCGHIAGVYARSDREFGFHRAPANLIIEGVLGLDPNSVLQNTNVNQIRSVQGRGIRVWGAETLSPEDNWKFINVRRVFITVQRWIETTLADVAFEPNDYKLWLRIKREVSTYLESLFRKGVFQGRTTKEAFYVKCDEETNPLNLRQQGQVFTEIGMAPAAPSQFVVVRLIHDSTGVSLMPSVPSESKV
ncbi:phage tail sheath family protein [Nostoc parmelioides]|nr:phage tail sheath C-terminal domain-containing protein [Nostoc parmelioides]